MKNNVNRKAEIVEAAMDIFKLEGFENTTIVDLCEKLKLPRSSFYYYFKYKEEILDYYFLTTEIELIDILKDLENAKTSYDAFIRIFTTYTKRTVQWGPNIFSHIIKRFCDGKNNLLSPMKIKMRDLYILLISKAQNNNEISNKIDAEKLVEIIVSVAVGLSTYWCNQDGNFDYEQKLLEQIDLLLNPAI